MSSGNGVAETEPRAMLPNDVTLLVTRYLPAVHQREVDFLTAHGLTVTGGDCLGVDTNTEMALIPSDKIADQARQAAAASGSAGRADTCFVSCAAIRSAVLIADLEAIPGMPVITSNQAMVWFTMHTLGIPKPG